MGQDKVNWNADAKWMDFRRNLMRCFFALVEDGSLLYGDYSGNAFYKHVRDLIDAWSLSPNCPDPTGRIKKWIVWKPSLNRELSFAEFLGEPLSCKDMLDSILDITYRFLNTYIDENHTDIFNTTYICHGPETLKLRWVEDQRINVAEGLVPGYFPVEVDSLDWSLVAKYKDIVPDNERIWLKCIRKAVKLKLVNRRRKA